MTQYDPTVLKAGVPTVLGAGTLRANNVGGGGLTTAGLAAGDACQVTSDLTLSKAVTASVSPIIGIYDAIVGSVVRSGAVAAEFVSGLTLVAGDVVYLSDEAGKLTNVKPTADALHEVGVVVDAASSKILLQQKPVIDLGPPPYTTALLWNSGMGGLVPDARQGPLFSLDSDRNRIVMFNGYSGSTTLDEVGSTHWTWEFDLGTNSWSRYELTPTFPFIWGSQSPASRRMVYDPVRGVHVGYSWSKQTWEYDAATRVWSDTGASPPANTTFEGCDMCWDSTNNRVLLYGGDSTTGIWAYNPGTTSWSQLAGNWFVAYPGLNWGACTWDSGRGCLVVQGGTYHYYTTQYVDQWFEWWPGQGWVERTPSGTKPGATAWHSLCYLPARGKTLFFQGTTVMLYTGPSTFGGGLGTCEDISSITPKPVSRSSHRVVYDPATRKMILGFGVGAGAAKYNDLWTFR